MNSNLSTTGKSDYRLTRSMGVWILFASFLVNCFLLGLLIAPVLRPPMLPPVMGPPGGIIEHLTRGLSPSDSAIIRDALKKEEPAFDESRQGMDKAMQDVLTVLQQPKLEPDELQKALHNVSESHLKLDEAMASSITQAVAQLSPEGRRHLATMVLPSPGMPMAPGMPMHPHP